jgi:transposase InsO family protein
MKRGEQGLCEHSRAPKSSPNGLPEKVIVDIVRLKMAHRAWGAKKIHEIYKKSHKAAPSKTSIQRIFNEFDLVKRRKIRKAYVSSNRLRQRILPEAANDVWAIDFKGWWKSNQEICEPLTIRDLYSRSILETYLMESKTSEAVRAVMTGVFKKYGLPKVIRTDNGTPFASHNGVLSLTNLSCWWITLGIIPDRIEKGKPGQNGSLERMHADIAREIEGKIPGGRRENQAALDAWREEYNTLRPNEAIGMRTPSELYLPSERRYNGDVDEIEYPPGFLPRRVCMNGSIKVFGQKIPISHSLTGYTLGLQTLDSGKYLVFLADFLLGHLDAVLCCFSPLESVES